MASILLVACLSCSFKLLSVVLLSLLTMCRVIWCTNRVTCAFFSRLVSFILRMSSVFGFSIVQGFSLVEILADPSGMHLSSWRICPHSCNIGCSSIATVSR